MIREIPAPHVNLDNTRLEGCAFSLGTPRKKLDWLGRNDPLPWHLSDWVGEVINTPMNHNLLPGEQNDAPSLMRWALDWKKWNLVRIVGHNVRGNDVVSLWKMILIHFHLF